MPPWLHAARHIGVACPSVGPFHAFEQLLDPPLLLELLLEAPGMVHDDGSRSAEHDRPAQVVPPPKNFPLQLEAPLRCSQSIRFNLVSKNAHAPRLLDPPLLLELLLLAPLLLELVGVPDPYVAHA